MPYFALFRCRSRAFPVASSLAFSVLVPLVGFAAPPIKPAANVRTSPVYLLFQGAIAATKAGDSLKAERLYRDALKIEPTLAPAWANLGLLLARKTGRTDDAIRALVRAAELAPREDAFWAQLSAVQLSAKRYADSAVSARKALALAPANGLALGNLATALMVTGKYAASVPILQRLSVARGGRDPQVTRSLIYALAQSGKKRDALTLARKLAVSLPRNADAQRLLADLSAQNGDMKGAQAAYARAAALAPADPGVAVNAALASEMAGSRGDAVVQLTRIVAAKPNYAPAHFHLGRLFYADPADKTGSRFKKAEAEFKIATSLDPKNPLYVTDQGLATLFQGKTRFDDARRLFRAALSLDPTIAAAHLGLATIGEQSGDFALAAAEYRATLAVDPNNQKARRSLAGALFAGGKKDEAYKEFDELARRDPKDTTFLKEAASLLLNDNRAKDAATAYETVVKRDPLDVGAHIGLGQALEASARSAEAEAQYRIALAVEPKNETATVALAKLLEAGGQPVEAIKAYENLARLDPQSNLAHYELGQLYNAQKRPDDALAQFRLLTLKRDDPNRLVYRMAPGSLLASLKRWPEAVTEFAALAAEERAPEVRYALAEAQEFAGYAADAEATLDALAREAETTGDPGAVPASRTALAAFYERQNRTDEAAKSFEMVLAAQPQNTDARGGLRRIREKQNKLGALYTFLEALAIGPADAVAPNLAATRTAEQTYLADRKTTELRDFARRLSARFPKSRDTLLLEARASLVSAPPTSAEREDAVAALRRAVALDPRDPQAQFQLGNHLEALNRSDEAAAAYRATLAADPQNALALAALKRLGKS